MLQHLADADALAKDTALPPDLLAAAVAGYCRDSIEDAAIEVARRRLPRDSRTVQDVEAVTEGASGTRARLGLALLGNARPPRARLDRELRSLGTSEVVQR